MMKKVIAIALTVMMLFGVCCAEEAKDEKDVLAIFDLVGMTDADGNEQDGELPTISVVLFKDGTGYFDYDDGEKPIMSSWTPDENGGFTLGADGEGDIQEFHYDEESGYYYLVDPEDDSLMLYAPQSASPVSVNAEKAEDFEGTWRITGVEKQGIYFDVSGEDEETLKAFFDTANPTVVIDAGNVNVLDGRLTGSVSFVDGALEVKSEQGNFTIEMTEDGGITFPAAGSSNTVFYADKVM